MKDRWLYLLAFGVAAICSVVILGSVIASSVRAALVQPLIYFATAMAVVLFLRMLFDPKCRRGIDAANVELRGDRPWPGMRKIKLSDPEWGIFGSRGGSTALLRLRAVLFLEFILAMLLSGRNGSDVLILAAAALFVVMMLSIIHIGMNTPVAQ